MSFVISGPLHKLSSRPEIPFRPSADEENPPHFQVTRPDASWVRGGRCLDKVPQHLGTLSRLVFFVPLLTSLH